MLHDSMCDSICCPPAEDGELELAMRSGKVRRLHPIPLNKDGEFELSLSTSMCVTGLSEFKSGLSS